MKGIPMKMDNKTCDVPKDSDVIDTVSLSAVVESLCATDKNQSLLALRDPYRRKLPSRDALVEIVRLLRSVLFPGYFGTTELCDENISFYVGSTLDRVLILLKEQVQRALAFVCDRDIGDCPHCEEQAEVISKKFLARLLDIRRKLNTDVQAAYEGDPAATCPEEVIISYPALLAISSYRLAHELYLLEVPLLPRIITEHAHSATGIDMHPGATIGDYFFIDHGTGVVIGETTVIGDRVCLYQGVTLGAKSFPMDENGNPIKGIPRHPVVEDDVIVYGGATILGRVTIGRGSTIGGNVWLTESVSPGSRISQAVLQLEQFTQGSGI
jgi:serine O-acetyltransferase